jgi:hypothetical protein
MLGSLCKLRLLPSPRLQHDHRPYHVGVSRPDQPQAIARAGAERPGKKQCG